MVFCKFRGFTTLSFNDTFRIAGTGSDLAKPIAVSMIGGVITSAIHVLFVTPIIFVMIKVCLNKKGKLYKSDMAKFIVH